MSEKHSFVLVKYTGRDTAANALAVLDELSEAEAISFEDAVAVYKNEKGKLKIHKSSKVITGRKGGIAGGATGFIIGTLMGGPILGALVGAAAGATFGKLTDLEGDIKKQIDEELSPADSALCVVIKKIDWPRVMDELRPHNFGGKLVMTDLAEDTVEMIEKLVENPEVAEAAAQTIEELTESPEGAETADQTTEPNNP